MKKISFIGYFLLCGIIIVSAQTLNSSETARLKSFLEKESTESGKKNYQQLGIQDLETVDWLNVTGLVWNANGRLDSMKWYNKKLGGDLDLSDFSEIRFIRCEYNGLTTIDVTGCTGLLYFDCFNNNFTSLDVSTNINLEWICCRWQNEVLKEIDLTHNPKLYHFCGTGNQFEYIDISKNPELIDFFCAATLLKSVDVSKNLKLKQVYLRGNQLSELDISNHPELEVLTCYDNQLSKLDVSGCPKLKLLTAHNNQLQEIKIDYLDMDVLSCQNNYLSFSNLPRLKSCVNFTYADQKTIKLLIPSNVVDLSSEYKIGNNFSEFFWTKNPRESKDGVFMFENTIENLTCYVINSTFPEMALTYEVEFFSIQSVDILQNIEVYTVGNQLVLKTDHPLIVAIYTVTGALAQQQSIVEGEYSIPLSKGMYIVKLSNGLIRKVVIR